MRLSKSSACAKLLAGSADLLKPSPGRVNGPEGNLSAPPCRQGHLPGRLRPRGGSPFTGRVSHPLDGEQSFMTSPHRHSPLTNLAWSHHAPTPRPVAACAAIAGRFVPVARAPLRGAASYEAEG